MSTLWWLVLICVPLFVGLVLGGVAATEVEGSRTEQLQEFSNAGGLYLAIGWIALVGWSVASELVDRER